MAANHNYVGLILNKLEEKRPKKVKKAFYLCRILIKVNVYGKSFNKILTNC